MSCSRKERVPLMGLKPMTSKLRVSYELYATRRPYHFCTCWYEICLCFASISITIFSLTNCTIILVLNSSSTFYSFFTILMCRKTRAQRKKTDSMYPKHIQVVSNPSCCRTSRSSIAVFMKYTFIFQNILIGRKNRLYTNDKMADCAISGLFNPFVPN